VKGKFSVVIQDAESCQLEARSTIAIALADEDKDIEPVPATGGGKLPEPVLARLSNILRAFNELFGNIGWNDVDKIQAVISAEIPAKVAADTAYQNAMKNSDKQNARIEHDKALQRVILELLSDNTELFKQFSDNPLFRKWLGDSNLNATYKTSPT
jgi:type I restriction enzyme R subunit